MIFAPHIFVSIGYGLFTLYLVYTGEITKFISPRFVWLTYFTGFSLGLFLLALSMRDISSIAKRSLWKDMVKGLLLIYPLILFFTIKPSAISEVNTPTVKTIPANTAAKKQTLLHLPTDTDGYVRLNLFELWLLARNYPELVQKYKFKTLGEISAITEKSISISRLFMTCCAADAMPVEVDVIEPKNRFNKGDWVEISGTVIVKDYVIIIPVSIVLAQRPSDPYITRWSEEPPFNP